MQTAAFGSSGLTVTRMGLGLAALGRPGYINLGHADDLQHDYAVEKMEAATHEMLDAAFAAGVRYFDAARSYGRAEAFLSSWLAQRQIASEEVVIGSKWGYTYTADWEVEAEDHEIKEHSLPVLERQIGESQALLGDHLNIYHIHSATLQSGVLSNVPVLQRLAQLRDEAGWLVGLSLSGAAQAETLWRALEVEIDGVPLFQSVQATWNILERSAEDALRAAAAAGWGVIIKEGVANGRLTPRNPIPPLAKLAADKETTPDALALSAILHQPWVSIVLSGAATPAHLTSNLAALDVAYDAATDAELRSLIETSEEYWQTRSQLAWN